MTERKTLGARLTDLMHARRLTVDQVAHRGGLEVEKVRDVLDGHSRWHNAKAVALGLGVGLNFKDCAFAAKKKSNLVKLAAASNLAVGTVQSVVRLINGAPSENPLVESIEALLWAAHSTAQIEIVR